MLAPARWDSLPVSVANRSTPDEERRAAAAACRAMLTFGLNAEEVVETGTPADVVEAAVDAIERHSDWDASTFRPGG